MSDKVLTIALDTNIYDNILDYHWDFTHKKTTKAIQPCIRKLYEDIIEGKVQLCVPVMTQEEMLCNYGKFKQFISFLDSSHANLVPCTTTGLLERLEKFVTNHFDESVKNAKHVPLVPYSFNELNSHEIKAKYVSYLDDNCKEMLHFYEEERERAEYVRRKPQYQLKKDLVVLLTTYLISKGLMAKDDLCDAFSVGECIVYGVDKFYTLNGKDFKNVKEETLQTKNRAFLNWFNNNKKRIRKAYVRVLSNLVNINKVLEEPSFNGFMKSLYNQFEIHEKSDSKHPDYSMKLRIPRIAEVFGFTEENFKTRIKEIGKDLKDYDLSEENLTNTKVEILQK